MIAHTERAKNYDKHRNTPEKDDSWPAQELFGSNKKTIQDINKTVERSPIKSDFQSISQKEIAATETRYSGKYTEKLDLKKKSVNEKNQIYTMYAFAQRSMRQHSI